MAEKVTKRKRDAFERRIAGAKKVEIKVTVQKKEQQDAYDALNLTRHDAARREIRFFDTPSLALSKAGLVLRARAIEDEDDDSVVKIRPVDPEAVDEKWLKTDGFKIEADSVGDKVVMSASLKARQKEGRIEKVASGEHPISKLFSKEQVEFMSEFHDGAVDLDALSILGPVRTLRADVDRPGMAYELTAEYWHLPDDAHLLELSIKCPPEEAVVARQVFEAFIGGHGLDPHGAQETKTKLALDLMAKRLEEK